MPAPDERRAAADPAPPIPAFDLGRAAAAIAPEVERRWRRLLAATSFVGGEEVAAFEREFAAYLGAAGCVAVANGTDALELALRALGLVPGDEVIVPSYTFVATAAAVVLAGGCPVFADVEPRTLNLDVAGAAARITERTAGIIGVHLYGRPFDVEGARSLCRERGLWLIEDAAQAHGAALEGRRAGTLGDLATWSFYPSKNLGCFGDGGAVTGGDAKLLEKVQRLANHGRVGHYLHAIVGRNSRLDALQAAVLRVRLERLDADNARRGEIACRYHGALAGAGDLALLEDPPGARSVYHQMTVRTARRDALKDHLALAGIGSAIHYPKALHLQDAFAHLPPAGELPVAEAAGGEVLCLPMYPELTDDEVDRVSSAVRSFFEGG